MQTNRAISAAADLVRRDGGIPGLGSILDPARLLTILSRELNGSRIEAFELVYLRYKPGMNCLARYDLRAGGHTINAYAKAYGQDAAVKLDKSGQRTVVDGILGPGQVVLKEQQIVFSTFPNDAKLASLQRLSNPDSQQRLFNRVFGPESEWQDCKPGPVLNYKPERRYVTRLIRADGHSALLKVYSRGGYGKARVISRKLGANPDGFYPETIGHSKKHAIIAYRWQPGTTLRQLSNDGQLSPSDVATAAGSLADFHASKQTGLLPLQPDEQAQRLDAHAQQMGFLLPHLKPRTMRVARQLSEWLAGRVPVRQTVHGDFYDKQAIVKNGKVRLIDLDAARLDSPLLDLGNYIAHLERQASGHAVATSNAAIHKDTLVSAYEQSAGSLCTDQLNKYIALGLFDLLHQPFRDWMPDWPAQTEHLLDRVETLLVA